MQILNAQFHGIIIILFITGSSLLISLIDPHEEGGYDLAVCFYTPLKNVFLPDNLDEDQGEVGAEGIRKFHSLLSVVLSDKGLFEPMLVGILRILLRGLPMSPPPIYANMCCFWVHACTHTDSLSLPPMHTSPGFSNLQIFFFFLIQVNYSPPTLACKALNSALVNLEGFLQQHSAVRGRDLLVESSIFSYVHDACLCSLMILSVVFIFL